MKFSFESAKSFLFFGSEIIDCESNFSENGIFYIKCLVINTGYNTYWGSFLQNILFPKKMNFQFYRELKIFLNVMVVLYVLTVGILTNSFLKQQNQIFLEKNFQGENLQNLIDKKNQAIYAFLKHCFDLVTVIIPPGLHISMNVISVYFNEALKHKHITCLSEKRLNAAGKVNTVVLDKTGTLTTDGLEITGFQSTECKERIKMRLAQEGLEEDLEYKFAVQEKSLRIFNSIHKEFWMRYCIDSGNGFYKDYQVNVRNNPVYFVECLATCLSIDLLKDHKVLGNAMDKILFKQSDWVLEKIDEKWNDFQVSDLTRNFLIFIRRFDVFNC